MNRNTHYFFTLLTFFFYTFTNLYAQRVIFEKEYGGSEGSHALKVLETMDGGLLMIGATNENTAGLSDFHLIKTDAQGNELWQYTHGGFNNDIPSDGIQLEDSSFIIVGFTGSFTTTPSRDVYLIKVDKGGSLVWTKSIGGGGTDEGTGIQQTEDGGFIISALTESFGAGNRDAWLIKTDSIGDTIWTRTFGGADFDDCWDVEIAADKGYVLTGGTHSLASGTEDDLWIIKTDSNGNEPWTQTFGVSNIGDWGWDLTVVDDGYVAVGLKNDNPTLPAVASGDAYFIKTDLLGNLLWDNTITHDFRLTAISIDTCSDGGFILAGTKILGPIGNRSSFWVARTNDRGSVLWTKDLGDTNSFNSAASVIQTQNGDIVAAGYGGLNQGINPKMRLIRLEDSTDQVGLKPIQLLQDQFTLYPNPSSGRVNIQLSKNSYVIKSVRVITAATAQVVKRFEVINKEDLSFEFEQAGLYLIQLYDKTGSLIASKRLIIAEH